MRHRPPPLPTFLAVYGLLYAAFGVQSPFLPALLREQGLRAEEIGIVLAASTAIRVLAGPAVGHVADRLTTAHVDALRVFARGGGRWVGLRDDTRLCGLARGGARPGGDVSSDSAALRCACDNCGTHERIRRRGDGSNMDGCARLAPLHS